MYQKKSANRVNKLYILRWVPNICNLRNEKKAKNTKKIRCKQRQGPKAKSWQWLGWPRPIIKSCVWGCKGAYRLWVCLGSSWTLAHSCLKIPGYFCWWLYITDLCNQNCLPRLDPGRSRHCCEGQIFQSVICAIVHHIVYHMTSLAIATNCRCLQSLWDLQMADSWGHLGIIYLYTSCRLEWFCKFCW